MVTDRLEHLFFIPRDFDASRKFYESVLGWQVVSEWTDNHGKKGVTLSGGGIRVFLAEAAERDEIRNDQTPHAPALYLDIHDVDKRFAQIPDGKHIAQMPQANRWGKRGFVLRDPDGNLIVFNDMRQ